MRPSRRVRREAKQLFRLCLTDGHLDEERARRVVRAVGQSDSRGKAAILAQLRRLFMLDLARRTARVDSAVALDEPLRADVRDRLQRLYGPGLDTSFAEDGRLIGGMRIKVGSDVYDGSVRAALDALLARL